MFIYLHLIGLNEIQKKSIKFLLLIVHGGLCDVVDVDSRKLIPIDFLIFRFILYFCTCKFASKIFCLTRDCIYNRGLTRRTDNR